MATKAWAVPRSISEATLARGASLLLWALVILAGFGGLGALLRTTSNSGGGTGNSTAGATVPDSRWAAAGFAERYVATYLLAGSDGASLAPFLGYQPDLPPTGEPASVVAPARTVEIARAGTDYWSVTVAVGPPGQERFWRAAVDAQGDTPVAVGLPAAVAAPPEVERVDLATSLGPVPADDPKVDTFTGFLGAYLCGQGDLSRYLRPELSLAATEPAVCTEVEVTQWGAISEDPLRETVVVEAVFSSGEGSASWQATYTAELARRDGRWEIAELLPAPPRDGDRG